MAKKKITKPVKLINAYDLFLPDEKSDKVFIVGGRGGDKSVQLATELLKRKVADAPVVDAVEVVRCRECRYRTQRGGPFGYYVCTILRGRWTQELPVDDRFFCGYGERKESDE